MPQSYGEVFTMLAARGVLPQELAARLRGAAGLRNLIAHRYATLDFDRVFAFASSDLDDLSAFCRELARRIEQD